MDLNIEATKDALERIEQSGSDMHQPMLFDFFVSIAKKENAQKISEKVTKLGFSTKIIYSEEFDDWTCECSKVIIPDLDTVFRIEQELNHIAKEFDGFIDGFGSYGNGEQDNT